MMWITRVQFYCVKVFRYYPQVPHSSRVKFSTRFLLYSLLNSLLKDNVIYCQGRP